MTQTPDPTPLNPVDEFLTNIGENPDNFGPEVRRIIDQALLTASDNPPAKHFVLSVTFWLQVASALIGALLPLLQGYRDGTLNAAGLTMFVTALLTIWRRFKAAPTRLYFK